MNAIQQSQAASAAAAEEVKSLRGTGKPTLPAPAIHDKKKKGKHKDNIIGRGKEGWYTFVCLGELNTESLFSDVGSGRLLGHHSIRRHCLQGLDALYPLVLS